MKIENTGSGLNECGGLKAEGGASLLGAPTNDKDKNESVFKIVIKKNEIFNESATQNCADIKQEESTQLKRGEKKTGANPPQDKANCDSKLKDKKPKDEKQKLLQQKKAQKLSAPGTRKERAA